jgi:N-acetylglutamate synthase-like GNAT family acetyltransferase
VPWVTSGEDGSTSAPSGCRNCFAGRGTALLEAAEEEARAQGCHGVYLTTFSFQAKPFYERLGYEVVADIPDYPEGHRYHVMKKTLG